jgi:hypothetical protein
MQTTKQTTTADHPYNTGTTLMINPKKGKDQGYKCLSKYRSSTLETRTNQKLQHE